MRYHRQLLERLEWLAQDDAVAAQGLLDQVAKREAEIAVQTLEVELKQLLALASAHPSRVVSATHTVSLPNAELHIHVSQSATVSSWRPPMSNEPNKQDEQRSSGNRGAEGNKGGHDLAPIQNPNDLLGEALRRMSPEKQQEIVGKATDEALRLQVKQKEGELDHEMAAAKVDSAADAARQLAHSGNQFEVRAEHRSEHGSVQVTVKNKQPSLSERVGGCFVATACYGDYSHPAVIVLRRFRDEGLRHNDVGRAFVAWYYRNSPTIATRIEQHTAFRAAVRIVLSPIVAGIAIGFWILDVIQSQREDQTP
jgi:hypothetical protein